jgi:hypothetical protein
MTDNGSLITVGEATMTSVLLLALLLPAKLEEWLKQRKLLSASSQE